MGHIIESQELEAVDEAQLRAGFALVCFLTENTRRNGVSLSRSRVCRRSWLWLTSAMMPANAGAKGDAPPAPEMYIESYLDYKKSFH